MRSFATLAGRLLCVLLASAAPAGGDATYGEAVAAFQRGDYESAASKLQALIDSSPRWAQGHVTLGQCHYLLGHPDEAERSFRRAVEIDPETDLYAAHMGAGLLLYDKKEYIEATRPLAQALGHAPENHRRSTGLKLGYAYYLGGRYEDAVSTFATDQRSFGFDPEPAYYLARACQRTGDYPCAIKNLGRVKGTEAGARPERKVLRYLAEWSRYWALAPQNKQKRATLLESALEHTRAWHLAEPDNAKATEDYGRTLLAAQRPKQLIDELVPIVARRPDDCVARTLIARAHNTLERRADAEKWSRDAGRCDPGSAEARLELAAALAGQLSPEHSGLEEVRHDQDLANSALESLERALELDPGQRSRVTSLRAELRQTADQLGEAAAAFVQRDEDYTNQVEEALLAAIRDRCITILWQMRDESSDLSPEDAAFHRENDCKQYAGKSLPRGR